MSRICLALSLLLATTTSASAQLRFAESSINLGEIRAGAPATCRFRFDNVGTTPIELIDLERSCGCLMPVWHERRLAPGQTGTLEMNFRTLGQPEGLRSWNATLVQRVGDETRRQALIVTATIRNEISIAPSQVAVLVQTSVEQTLVLTDRRDRPLNVVDVTTKGAGIRIATSKSGPGKTTIRLVFDAAAMTPGQHDEVLTIRTDDPAYPSLEVPLTVTRVEKRTMTWSPELPEVVLAPGQKQATALVQIRSEKPLAIRAIESSEPGLSCTWGVSDDGATLRLRVDRSTYRGQSLAAHLRVLSEGPPISIPVLIEAE
jgi:Protein of unknown function (DUF1573)